MSMPRKEWVVLKGSCLLIRRGDPHPSRRRRMGMGGPLELHDLGLMKVRDVVQLLGLFLDGGSFCFFPAFGADERQEVLGVERIAANGLLSGGAESDVDTAIVGQDEHLEVAHHFLTFVGTQVGIVRHLLFDLVGSELVLLAEGLQLKMISGNAVFYQETLGAFHAALCKFLVIFGGAARICVAAEDQMSVGHVFQIAYEVGSQCVKDVGLTVEQAAFGMLGGGASGLEIDAMKRESGLQLFDLRRRRRRGRRSLYFHHSAGGCSERRSAVIVHVAGDGDTAWLRAL